MSFWSSTFCSGLARVFTKPMVARIISILHKNPMPILGFHLGNVKSPKDPLTVPIAIHKRTLRYKAKCILKNPPAMPFAIHHVAFRLSAVGALQFPDSVLLAAYILVCRHVAIPSQIPMAVPRAIHINTPFFAAVSVSHNPIAMLLPMLVVSVVVGIIHHSSQGGGVSSSVCG